MPLNGKTICITGATSGFGKACAELLIQKNARVIITGRRKTHLDALQKTLGANAHAIVMDVQNVNKVKAALHSLPKPFAFIDALINNAGLALGMASFENQTSEDIEQMINTNIKGVIHCTQAILPNMVARNSGHIINIGSIAGVYPYPGANVYGATKAFLAQFSLNLRADLLGKNIRVTVIEPGMAETEFALVRFHGDHEKAKDVYKNATPLRAEDIAQAIFWCLSQPPHINVNRLEIMPTMQAFSPFAVHRENTN